MASVEIVDAKKSYGSLEVIHGVNLNVADGEFVVLVGPSGCGKSTLLRMIAGLESITSGEISIGERLVNDVLPKDRDIAMVFQNYALYPHMTVWENIAFPLKMNGVAQAEIDRRVSAAAEVLGLLPYLNRHPRHLSGGQRQRVAMGRAIVRRPKAFLFDEPLSNLDAKLRVQMRTEIKELHQRIGTTSIYVTHDQVEAMTMADRIVVMRDGIIEQVGSPLDLYDHPVNTFVAAFIGSPSINFLSGKWDRINQKFKLAEHFDVDFPATDRPSMPDEIVYGIRPEHLAISATEEGIPAQVAVVEPTGAQTQVLFKTTNKSDLTAIFSERINLNPGETVRLVPSITTGHFFDAGTGARIL